MKHTSPTATTNLLLLIDSINAHRQAIMTAVSDFNYAYIAKEENLTEEQVEHSKQLEKLVDAELNYYNTTALDDIAIAIAYGSKYNDNDLYSDLRVIDYRATCCINAIDGYIATLKDMDTEDEEE